MLPNFISAQHLTSPFIPVAGYMYILGSIALNPCEEAPACTGGPVWVPDSLPGFKHTDVAADFKQDRAFTTEKRASACLIFSRACNSAGNERCSGRLHCSPVPGWDAINMVTQRGRGD